MTTALRALLPARTVSFVSLPSAAVRTFTPLISRLQCGRLDQEAHKSFSRGSRPPRLHLVSASSVQTEAMAKTEQEKLSSLRAEMKTAGIDAYVVPSEDPHMSEYAPAFQGRREYISNFTGSAGTAVITHDGAYLWTDGRYFIQAKDELGPGWTLMKSGVKGVPTVKEWLCQASEVRKVGIDPLVHTLQDASELMEGLESVDKMLVPIDVNLVDRVWGAERPAPPTAPLRVHPSEWAGEDVISKVERVFEEATNKGADALLVTALDEVGWLLNLRGSDVNFNPVFISYVIITGEGATLYVDEAKITQEVKAHLEAARVSVKPYEQALDDVSSLGTSGKKVLADPKKVSFAVARAAGYSEKQVSKKIKISDSGAALIKGDSPVSLAKAVKNDPELMGMKEAHLRDSVALARFFHWLDVEVAKGTVLTEVAISDKLLALRMEEDGFIEPSFPTIAGADSNGAIIHYRPLPGPNNKTICKDTMLLVDSGGQYNCGTTDVTRTVHFGVPTEHQCRAFTAVLKGHIALDVAIFPEGTPGFCLDTLARTALWTLGLNYRHGTGHGVGAAMNVHEGPQSISQRYFNTQGLLDGMVCSNEPGYYEEGGFGIRIELALPNMQNLVIIKEVTTPLRFDPDVKSLGFERLTMHPIQSKLILKSMLSAQESQWLVEYHQEIWDKVAPRLKQRGFEDTAQWLKAQCEPHGAVCN